MHDHQTPVPSPSIPWRMLGGLLLGSLVLGAFSFLRPFSLTFGDHLLPILNVLYGLFLALVCFRGSWKLLKLPHPPEARKLIVRRFIPTLLGTGAVWVVLSLLVWQCETLGSQQAPTYPSLSDTSSYDA